jgi:hypothetical protein
MRGVLANRIRSGVLIALVMLLGAVGTVGQAYTESAAGSSFWPPDIDPELYALDGFEPTPTCEKRTVNIPRRRSGKIVDVPTEKCFIDTTFGLISTDSYLKLPNEDFALKLHTQSGSASPWGIPDSDILLYGSGGLAAFRNVTVSDFEQMSGYNAEVYIYRMNRPFDWSLKDEAGDTRKLRGAKVVYSGNKKFIVAETYGYVFVRINLETFEEFDIPAHIPKYGSGLNPSANVAVSDDGRYIAVSGSNVNKLMITDTEVCDDEKQPVAGLNISYYECQLNDLTSFMRQQLPGYTTSLNMAFNPDATMLTMYAGGYGEYVALVSAIGTEPGLDYLGLGDSFSSGEGDREGDEYYMLGTNGDGDFSEEKCHLSNRSYPFLVAARTGLSSEAAKSIACSGAKTEDVFGAHYDSRPYNGQYDQFKDEDEGIYESAVEEAINTTFFPGRAAQIEFVRKHKPKFITLTMGGNDVGFGHKLEACINKTTEQNDPTCYYAIERKPTGDEILRQFDNLKQLYLTLQHASPKTQIYVLGYPQFFGDWVCGQNVRLDASEREFITNSILLMNEVTAAATRAAGVIYVDVSNSLDGYNLCSGTSDDAFNGITYGKDQGVGGLNFISNGSYHPNDKGHELITTEVLLQVPDIKHRQKCGGQTVMCSDNTVASPQLPDYFKTSDSNVAPYSLTLIDRVVNKSLELAENGKVWLDFTLDQLKSSTITRVELHSDPILLGEFEVDGDGTAHILAAIPEDVPFGYHTLNIYATTQEDEEVKYYQGFWYISSEDDMDGDGVQDAQQECVFGVICDEEDPVEPQQSHLPQQASPVAHAAAPFNETAFNRAAHTNRLTPDEFIKGLKTSGAKIDGLPIVPVVAHQHIDEAPSGNATVLVAASVVVAAAAFSRLLYATRKSAKA